MTKEEKLLQHFQNRCAQIISSGLDNKSPETDSEKKARVKKLLSNYGDFFSYYFPHYCDGGETACADYHVKTAHKIARNKTITAFLLWHRGAAKSTHATVGIPLFMLFRGEIKFMVIMGYNRTKTLRLLSDIQAELKENKRLINDFGNQFNWGDWSSGSFTTVSGTAFEATSILQDPSGLRNGPYRPDYCVVDDVDNRKKSRNKAFVNEVVENIVGALREGMSKDRQRIVIANNYKVKDGVIARLLRKMKRNSDTFISKVNAVDKEGNPTWKRYTREYWEKKFEKMDEATRLREYFNTPVEGGTIFKEKEMIWERMPKLSDFEAIVGYGDLSYVKQGDTKAWAILGKIGRKYYLTKCFCRKTDLSVAVAWIYDVWDKHLKDLNDVSLFYDARVSQKAMYEPEFDAEGDERGYYVPIVADTDGTGNKFDKIEKLVPYFKRGDIIFDLDQKDNSDYEAFVGQFIDFERGSSANDDAPDCFVEGLLKLNKRTGGRRNNGKNYKTNPRRKPKSSW